MINYIVQVVLFQILFLVVYDLFLQKETFFKWNRIYLLATPVLSFVIPLLKFESVQKFAQQENIIWLPEVVLNPEVLIMGQLSNPEVVFIIMNWVFYIGMVVTIFVFALKLAKIIRLIQSNKRVKKQTYSLVLLEDNRSAFSFFKFIFIHKQVLDKDELQIIQHELVHCKQLHSLDLIFFELFKIVMWFNPLIYSFQKRITVLHEYISDAEVVKESDKKTYFNNLLSETFNVKNISFTNQFYKQSLIKKRIAMITKTQSHKLKQLKYLVLIPLLGGMLMYTSCETNEIIPNDVIQEKLEFPNNDEPLMLVDGEEVSLDFVNDLKPNKIQSINVLKGEKAISAYGEKARNGAVQITLKKDKVIEVKMTEEQIREMGENVPFARVEEPPIFPGCEGSRLELKACLNKELQKHVARKFNADLAGSLDFDPGRKKIYIQFKILKDGNIEIIGARAPHPALEEEAKRVVNLLPKMTPGKFDGKAVNVTYMLPISFNVEEK